MKSLSLKTLLSLLLTCSFLIMAFVTEQQVNSRFYISLAIMTGAFAIKFVSNSNTYNNEKN